MKVINDLVVVEVPKGCGYSISGTNLWLDDDGVNIDDIELPFPCTIIGLASKVDEKDAIQMLQMHGIILPADYEPIHALHGQVKRIYGMEITETTDLLFLKRN